jgi:hypothetical protein
MQGKELLEVREHFFEGETCFTSSARVHRQYSGHPPTAVEMLHRIDPRLRSVVVKACLNSEPATRVVDLFEKFVVASFCGMESQLPGDWWRDLLMECPTITKKESCSSITVRFFFEAVSSKGGFHRLLLCAVSQFHGLNAISKMVKVAVGEALKARTLIVTGSIDKTRRNSLLDHLSRMESN